MTNDKDRSFLDRLLNPSNPVKLAEMVIQSMIEEGHAEPDPDNPGEYRMTEAGRAYAQAIRDRRNI